MTIIDQTMSYITRSRFISSIFSKRNAPFLTLTALLVLFLTYHLALVLTNYWLSGWDVARDYLVVRMMITDRQFPAAGPGASFSPIILNSSVYFYLLSLFLLLRNSIVFLGVVNVCMQAISILLIYALGRRLFTPLTGVVAAWLYAFGIPMSNQALHMWQPYLMITFLYLSYLLLWHGYRHRIYAATITGVIVYFFAAVLHLSAFTALPFVFVMVVGSLRHMRAGREHIALLFGVTVATGYLFFYPILLLSIKQYALTHATGGVSNLLITDPAAYIAQAWRQMTYFIQYIFTLEFTKWAAIRWFALALSVGSIGYAVVTDSRRSLFRLMFLYVISILAVISLFRAQPNDYYSIAAVGPFYLLVAEGIRRLFQKTQAIQLAVLMLLMVALSTQLYLTPQWQQDENNTALRAASRAIADTVRSLEKTDMLATNHFIIETDESHPNFISDHTAPFWLLLEPMLHQRLVRLSSTGNWYEATVTKVRYVFAVCIDHTGPTQTCHENIARDIQYRTKFRKEVYNEVPYFIQLWEIE